MRLRQAVGITTEITRLPTGSRNSSTSSQRARHYCCHAFDAWSVGYCFCINPFTTRSDPRGGDRGYHGELFKPLQCLPYVVSLANLVQQAALRVDTDRYGIDTGFPVYIGVSSGCITYATSNSETICKKKYRFSSKISGRTNIFWSKNFKSENFDHNF